MLVLGFIVALLVILCVRIFTYTGHSVDAALGNGRKDGRCKKLDAPHVSGLCVYHADQQQDGHEGGRGGGYLTELLKPVKWFRFIAMGTSELCH